MTKFDPKKLKELQEAAGQEEWNPGVGTGAMVRLVRYLHNYVNDIIQMSDELAMTKFDPKKLKELQSKINGPRCPDDGPLNCSEYLLSHISEILQMSDELAMAKSRIKELEIEEMNRSWENSQPLS